MKTKTFIGFMFLLLVLTSFLLALSVPEKQEQPAKECPAGSTCNDGTQLQSAEGSMIWESFSRHLLSAVQ
jgi:hypothetical protein